MNAWKPILLLARRSLIALGLVVVLCAGLTYGLASVAESLKQAVLQLRAQTQDQEQQLGVKREDLVSMAQQIKHFEQLRAQGLLGTPERTQWVEQLESTYQERGLPGAVIYQLQVPKPLAATVDQAALPLATNTSANSPQAHDLQIEVRNVQEVELLDFIAAYRAQVKGRFRVQSCTLRDPVELGLTALCVLRFISIPLAAPAGAAAPAVG